MRTATFVDVPVGHLLADAALRGTSGILTALRGKHRRLFCVEGGRIVHAVSNVIEEQFTEALLAERLVSVGDLAGAQRQSARQGLSLTQLLADAGLVPRETLLPALEAHTRQLLFSTLDWHPNGDVRFEAGRPDLGREVRVQLSAVSLLLDYARVHVASLVDVKARLGSPEVALVVNEERRALLEELPGDDLVRSLVARCHGETTILDLVRDADPPEAGWRALYAAGLLGLVAPAAGATAAITERLTREEILNRVERARNSDYYGVLEIGAAAPREKIREAYYVLARQYHPDRFRSGPLKDLREQVEGYFARVTEAYNTLQDLALRAAYDEQLASERDSGTAQDTIFLARENFRRAQELVARGRLRDAVTSIENAIKLDPRNATYRLEAGRLLGRNPRMRDQAEAHLREATRLDPSLAAGYEELGELYARAGRHREAAELFREVLRWDPTHARASLRLAELGG